MIINQTRIKTSGASNVITHVNKRDDNEVCQRIFGSEDNLLFSDELAQLENRKYSIRHFTVSPDQELSEKQTREMLQMLNAEFDFKDRDIAVYRHVKERSNGSKAAHFHILVSEQNAEGKTMSNKMNYARNEKCARALEIRFGHEQTPGAHNRAVVQAAPARTRQHLDALTDGPRPRSAFSSKAHQKAKRLNVDLPRIAHEMTKLQETSNAKKGEALAKLAEKHNVIFERGDRKNVILLKDENRNVISNANKVLDIKSADVSEIIAATQARKTALHAENRDRHDVEEVRQHRANVRSSATDESVSVRSRRSDERTSASVRQARSNSATSRATRTDQQESDRASRSDAASSRRDSESNRVVQLSDRDTAKQRLNTAATRSAAKKSKQQMKFGNETSSQTLNSISSSPEPVSLDTDDPLYAEKALDAWRRSMQSNAPKM